MQSYGFNQNNYDNEFSKTKHHQMVQPSLLPDDEEQKISSNSHLLKSSPFLALLLIIQLYVNCLFRVFCFGLVFWTSSRAGLWEVFKSTDSHVANDWLKNNNKKPKLLLIEKIAEFLILCSFIYNLNFCTLLWWFLRATREPKKETYSMHFTCSSLWGKSFISIFVFYLHILSVLVHYPD